MIAVMLDRVQAQDASLTQFSIDGQVCFIVPEDASEATAGLRIVGSVTLGKRRYSICSDQPNTHAAPADLLTSRELQIAVLIAQGFDKKAIGRRLGISPLTVGTHLARTYARLGVKSRAALAARIAGTVALHRRSANSARPAEQALPPT
jgi:DNA-binding CsgD family transcriptional regulator